MFVWLRVREFLGNKIHLNSGQSRNTKVAGLESVVLFKCRMEIKIVNSLFQEPGRQDRTGREILGREGGEIKMIK